MGNQIQRVTKMEQRTSSKDDELINFQLGHSGREIKITNRELSEILKKVEGATRGLPNLTQTKIED
jgi:hypothetical protein